MDASETDKKPKAECYNCYKLIPSDSKYCPYCGHNQLEKTGYTLRSTTQEQPTQQVQENAPPPMPIPAPAPAPPPVNYGRYAPYRGYPGAMRGSEIGWADIAKYAGVIGTLLFLMVLFLEFAGVFYGFTYLPQMNASNYIYPFYFFTPYIIGIYAITGFGFVLIYVLFVMITAVCMAYVLRDSKQLRKELKPVSKGVQSSSLFLIGTLVMTYYFISVVDELILFSTGTSPTAPNFGAAPWYLNVFGFVYAPVWEEIAARVILIGLPLMVVARLSGKMDRPWWKYLTGGNMQMKPVTVFFLIISSVMFGLGHWLAGSGWGFWKIFPAAIAGLFMGYLFLKKGLFAAIIFHFAIDSQAILILSPSSNTAVISFLLLVDVFWMIVGAIFFVYYLLVMLGYITSRNLLPKSVRERYSTTAATAAAPAPGGNSATEGASYSVPGVPVYIPPSQSPPPQQEPHPYRPPQHGTDNVMRDPHIPVPMAPGEPIFGYMCSNCGSLEAKYRDGKFVCVYCGHESDR